MLRLIFALAALSLASCAPPAPQTQGCERIAAHEVTWSGAAPDAISARAEGPSCAQAVVTLAIRNSAGDPLWAFASTYYDLTAGGVPPEGAPAVTPAEMDTFLAGWANFTELRTSALPAWSEGAATLSDSAAVFAYDTPFDRDTYEMLRARDLPALCYAAAVEATQCLIIDPLSNAPTMMVAYGP